MPRLDRLSELARKTLLTHNVLINEDAPWTPLGKPLSQATVALVTTGGLHLRSDHPFTNGDQTFRTMPSDSAPRGILLSHTSIGFDRSGVIRDLNLWLPIDRLRDLVAAGEIGGIGPNMYSFLGAQRKYDGLINESGPEVGRRLKAEGVDAILMTGA